MVKEERDDTVVVKHISDATKNCAAAKIKNTGAFSLPVTGRIRIFDFYTMMNMNNIILDEEEDTRNKNEARDDDASKGQQNSRNNTPDSTDKVIVSPSLLDYTIALHNRVFGCDGMEYYNEDEDENHNDDAREQIIILIPVAVDIKQDHEHPAEEKKDLHIVASSQSVTPTGLHERRRDHRNRNVTFGEVQVREYERVIDTSMYMGLSLGWAYTDHPPTDVIEDTAIDGDQDSLSLSSDSCSRYGGEFKAKTKKPHERFSLFFLYGYTRKQLRHATFEVPRATNHLKYATFEVPRATNQREREASRRLVIQEKNNKNQDKPSDGTWAGRRMLRFRSSWGR
jgi:hypothetical protein